MEIKGVFPFLVLLGVFAVTEGIDSNCTFQSLGGRSGRLSCQFSEDIGKQKRAFQVIREPFSTKNDKQELILDCVWLKNIGIDCTFVTTKVFEFGNNVSNRLDIDIPSLSSDWDGDYKCILVPPDGSHVSSCRYYDPDYRKEESKSKPQDPITATEDTAPDAKESSNSPSSGNYTKYLTAVIIMTTVALLATAGAVVMMMVYKRSEPKPILPTTICQDSL